MKSVSFVLEIQIFIICFNLLICLKLFYVKAQYYWVNYLCNFLFLVVNLSDYKIKIYI